jgi:uncharacterized delta-60 repeat protein
MLVVGVTASLIFSAAAIAAAGDPDPTFSADGKQRTDFGTGPSAAEAVVRQADGKIIAVGAADGDFLVTRYNLDGSLDMSFSGDGRTRTSFSGGAAATAVALQPDGKIVVVGSESDLRFALARYNPNGSLDTSFSGDGKQTTFFTISGEFIYNAAFGVALQGNGKIIAVGGTGSTGPSDFALARYSPNGSLDTSFSGDGKQTTDFGSANDGARAVALQADGKIVAVGSAGAFDLFALARYNPNGSLDTSFSVDGRQTTAFGGFATGVALQGDGRIVAVGRAGDFSAGESDFGLARYSPNGSLDTSFSGDGKQTTDFLFGANDVANDVAIQANGRIVAVGLAGGGATGNDFGLARYNANGTLDTSFSADGRKRTSFGGSDSANGVALQGDGRIVAVGAGNGEFALARYLGG